MVFHLQLVVWNSMIIAFKAAADQGIGFYAQIFVRTSLFFAARFTLRLRVRFSTQNQSSYSIHKGKEDTFEF